MVKFSPSLLQSSHLSSILENGGVKTSKIMFLCIPVRQVLNVETTLNSYCSSICPLFSDGSKF